MPSDLLASAILVEGAVARAFEGFLFLCGGRFQGGGAGELLSARQFALEKSREDGDRLAGAKVIVAETVTQLLEGSDFSNLLEFEEYLAALAACVVIFVESPGSIAELGSFAVMSHLAPKLLVVCEQSYEAAPSFIFNGPVALLRSKRTESVQIFPLHDEVGDGVLRPSRPRLSECWKDLRDAIEQTVRRPIQQAPLDLSELPHRLLLISELVDLLVVLRLSEIASCLSLFGATVSQGELSRCLRVLEKFELIEKRSWGHEQFYISTGGSTRIVFRDKNRGRIFDRERFKMSAIEHYKKHDPRKARALASFSKRRGAA